MPADLDTAFVEITEEFDFDWPESLAAERVHVGKAAIVAAAFVFAGIVVLAQRAISIRMLDQSVPHGRRVVESSMQNRNRY